MLPKWPRHCLRICIAARRVWCSISLLLTRIVAPIGFVTWGAVAWLLQFPGSHLLLEGEDADLVFMLTVTTFYSSTIAMLPPSVHDFSTHSREPIFSTMASISLCGVFGKADAHMFLVTSRPPVSLHDMDRAYSHSS